jgi:hypothetical protein
MGRLFVPTGGVLPLTRGISDGTLLGSSGTRAAALRTRSAWLGDAALSRLRIMGVLHHRDVPEGDDADEAFLSIQDRQAPHLEIRHVVRHISHG